jgi:tricorn protease
MIYIDFKYRIMPIKRYLSFLGLFACMAVQAQQKGYYRSPAITQNTVVFTAEGDLWKYDLSTGATSRITTNGGVETNPVISADGKKLAFIGQYEGPSEVYIMELNGGVPRRLTYDFGRGIQLSGFTKEGKILYRTSIYSGLPSNQLAVLDPATYRTELLPLAEASQGCYDEEGKLYFTRLPNQGSKTKRYKGGYIEQIWKFDGKQEAVNLTADYTGTSSNPMYYNNRVYFVSDRDGTMNIWSMDKNGKNIQQNTFSKGWDVQTPAIGQSKIVYQKGADIWVYDITANTEKMLDITLLSDFDQRKPKWIKSPVESISKVDLSPNGAYVGIISRGRVFVSPSKSDRWVEVTRKSGIRCRDVHFMNNKTLAVLSDESGEWEVWAMPADGSGTPKQITKNTKTQISLFQVSPNEKFIAYSDRNDVLRVADVATGQVKFTYDSIYGGSYGITWSPDSRFLTFTVGIENLNAQIRILDMNNMRTMPITTPRLDSYSPAWSADSNWFYFVSDRNLKTKVRSPWGARQPEPFYSETSNIYALPLDTAISFPFLQTDSWLADTAFTVVDSAQKAALAKAKNRAGVKHRDWSRAIQSLYQAPVKSSNIAGIDLGDGYLYWADWGNDYTNPVVKLYALKIAESKKYEPIEVASDIAAFNISGNKKKLLVAFKNRTMAIVDANGAKVNMADHKVELNNWSFSVNPVEDWKQMYDDAWRMMRDYFYDRKLHNVNWQQIHDQYAPLVARLTDRYEFDNLISQVVGELSALHTFVFGGDKRTSPDMIQIGNLGALLTKNEKGFVITHIYKSDPDYPELSSPLNKPELRIKEGDMITAVNNTPLNNVANIAELLTNKVNVPVKLTVKQWQTL